ncbi:MAG: hypothetical protein ABFS32_17150 [Bacteroidota bacterium]
MATLEEMRSNVKIALDEEDISDDLIDARINEGLLFCSRYTTLTDLEAIGTFDTALDSNEVPIPVEWNYQRKIYDAGVPETPPIVIAASLAIFKTKYPKVDIEIENGDIAMICARKGTLIYFPVPEQITTVTCKFYENPTPLKKPKDVPDCLPVALHNTLLESYALWKTFALIEVGVEGPKTNTKYYKNEFYEAVALIDEYLDEGQSSPEPVRGNSWI